MKRTPDSCPVTPPSQLLTVSIWGQSPAFPGFIPVKRMLHILKTAEITPHLPHITVSVGQRSPSRVIFGRSLPCTSLHVLLSSTGSSACIPRAPANLEGHAAFSRHRSYRPCCILVSLPEAEHQPVQRHPVAWNMPASKLPLFPEIHAHNATQMEHNGCSSRTHSGLVPQCDEASMGMTHWGVSPPSYFI